MKNSKTNRGGTEKINQIVYEFIHNQNWNKALYEANAVDIYNKLDDDLIKNHSVAYQVASHDLFIYVDSPIIANQIYLRSVEIIHSINQKLKEKIIRKLRFKVAEVKRLEEDTHLEFDPIEGISLSHNEKGELEQTLAEVEDIEIKDRLNQLFTSIIKNNKRKNNG